MEAKLEKLVDGLMRLADLRNLDYDNPIKVTLQTGELFPVITLVSMQEPSRGKYPLDLIWVDADPVSHTYRRIFKRTSKQPNRETPLWSHSWTALYYYKDVFTPNQHYEDGDDENVIALQEVLEHIHNITGNPHHISSERIGALPITGGTMRGDLILASDLTQDSPPLAAAPRQYVDVRYGLLLDATDSLEAHVGEVATSVETLKSWTLPQIINTNNLQDASLQKLEADQQAVDLSLSFIRGYVNQHTEEIAALQAALGLGTGVTYLTQSAFDSFVTGPFASVTASLADLDQTTSRLDQTTSRLDQTTSRLDQTTSRLDQATSALSGALDTLRQDYEAFKALATSIFNAAHVRVKAYVHRQTEPDTQWWVRHGLGSTNFVVQLYTVQGEQVYANSVRSVDNDNLLIVVNAPLAGTATVVAL